MNEEDKISIVEMQLKINKLKESLCFSDISDRLDAIERRLALLEEK